MERGAGGCAKTPVRRRSAPVGVEDRAGKKVETCDARGSQPLCNCCRWLLLRHHLFQEQGG